MTSPSETIAKALEGVTHGEWYLAGKLTIRHTSPVGGADGWIGKVNWRNGEANAAYIAACSPDRMREVLDELYALRESALQFEAMKREMAELREALTKSTIERVRSLLDWVDEHEENASLLIASLTEKQIEDARAALKEKSYAGN